MSDFVDLFPGFESRTFQTSGADIFARVGGSGPPLLMLHGYPQSHVMWHAITPALSEHFTCILADLRGYGQSSAPATDADHYAYSKRAMAGDFVEIMDQLGHQSFLVLAHDRGGRVAYRMALDTPGKIERMALLDIVPTHAMWHGLNPNLAMKIFHWTFLAQPAPLPENMIAADPIAWLNNKLAGWGGTGDLSIFSPDVLTYYRTHYSNPSCIHASCEDYRAGAGYDLAADEADKIDGKKISCPTLVLWGASGIPSKSSDPMKIWREWCDDVRGEPIDSGHFLAEENPQDTLKSVLPFLRAKRDDE